MSNTLPLPEPWDYCYEWNGPFGTRKFSAASYNGNRPDRSVPIYTADQMHAHAAAVSAAKDAEIERLRAEVAGLREALQGVLPWVVTQEVACNGLKCREPICMSCDSDSEANAQLACNAYAKASAALAARKGEA